MRVVVIGAGLLGATTAWFLAQDGHEVTVLDRNNDVAEGTSYANAGMLTPSMPDPWNAPGIVRQLLGYLGKEDAPLLLRGRALPGMIGWGLAFLANSRRDRFATAMEANLRLARYSVSVTRELRTSLKLAYDERAKGTLKVFRDQRSFDQALTRFELLARMGLSVKALDGAQVAAFEPSLSDVRASIVGGVYCEQDESGDARRFAVELARKARDAGVDFRFNANVTGFTSDSRKVTKVIAGAQSHPSDAVVIAAGAWSHLILRKLGIRLPVRPVKGYSITVGMQGWRGRPALPIVDDALHAAATPLGDRLRVAGTAEFAGFDSALTPSRVDNLFHLLLAMFPSFAPHLDRARAAPWAGFRPMTSDGLPRIGRLGLENVYANTGHGHLGWTLAAGSGRMLADIIASRNPEIDAKPYQRDPIAADRFC